jgi:hypothetical protein
MASFLIIHAIPPSHCARALTNPYPFRSPIRRPWSVSQANISTSSGRYDTRNPTPRAYAITQASVRRDRIRCGRAKGVAFASFEEFGVVEIETSDTSGIAFLPDHIPMFCPSVQEIIHITKHRKSSTVRMVLFESLTQLQSVTKSRLTWFQTQNCWWIIPSNCFWGSHKKRKSRGQKVRDSERSFWTDNAIGREETNIIRIFQ